MSATVAAALKKIAVAILTDKKLVRNAAVRFSTAASPERKWSCQKPMMKPKTK